MEYIEVMFSKNMDYINHVAIKSVAQYATKQIKKVELG